MRREITIYIRFADSETAASLEDLADSCYIALDEIRLLEPHQGYSPHCVIAQGEEAQITAFTEALSQTESGLRVGQVSVRDV